MSFLRLVLLTAAFISLAACRPENAPIPTASSTTAVPSPIVSTSEPKFPAHPSDLGVVEVGVEVSCFVTRNPSVEIGTKLVVIFPEKPQWFARATVVDGRCERGNLDLDLEDASEYRVDFGDDPRAAVKLTRRGDFAGIGVTASTPTPAIRNGVVSFDIDDDGNREYFSDCTGNESYHLMIWRGRPRASDRIWLASYHFNYDTVPTCRGFDAVRDPP